MDLITRPEELILLAVCHLGENAYGVTIRDYLWEEARQKLSIGGVYVPLDRLVRKGLLKTRQGKPTPTRGGMSKRFYLMTPKGVRALNEAKQVHDHLWGKVPAPSFAGE
jgi:DNA-binding PadR family transcriptional regulator